MEVMKPIVLAISLSLFYNHFTIAIYCCVLMQGSNEAKIIIPKPSAFQYQLVVNHAQPLLGTDGRGAAVDLKSPRSGSYAVEECDVIFRVGCTPELCGAEIIRPIIGRVFGSATAQNIERCANCPKEF